MYMKFAHKLSVFLYIRRSYDHYIDEKNCANDGSLGSWLALRSESGLGLWLGTG